MEQSLSDNVITVRLSTASALKITAYKKHAVVVKVVEQTKNREEQKLSLIKGSRGNTSAYPRYTERAVWKLIKIFSVEETNLAEDFADLSKEMKLIWTLDVSLLDLDYITVQVFTAKPRSYKSKKAQKGERCCEEHCSFQCITALRPNLRSVRSKLVEVEGEFEDDNQTEQDDGIF
jgi:hypothetical protein